MTESEVEVPVAQVQVGDVVVVRPGETIPVDGEVLAGQATVNQAAITGESMPIEAVPGTTVFAATQATLGSLRIRATKVGKDTTFGRVITLVEGAEANRADVQRLADRFSGYFLPIVVSVAVITYLLSRNPLSVAAVLVVACSCSLALATPIAMLAAIGGAAKQGLLIKGGKYIETLAQADVLLVDKTGTLTQGKPRITDIVTLNGLNADELLQLAASVERDSEHPLASAVRNAAAERGLPLTSSRSLYVHPWPRRARPVWMARRSPLAIERLLPAAADAAEAVGHTGAGKTLLYIARDDELIGALAAADTVRPEVPAALQELRAMGITQIELLTGDNERNGGRAGSRAGHCLPRQSPARGQDRHRQGVPGRGQDRGHGGRRRE